MRVISVLRMQVTEMDVWWQLSKQRKSIAKHGLIIANLWELTLHWRQKQSPSLTQIRTTTGFAAQVKQGYFGFGNHAAARSITAALMAGGQALSLDIGVNSLKVMGSNKFFHQIEVCWMD